MAESTLSLSLVELKRSVCFYAGYGHDYDSLDSSTQLLIDDIINGGLRKFYYPSYDPSDPNNPNCKGYSWKFLKPTYSLQTALVDSGDESLGYKEDYDLPDHYSGYEGVITYTTQNVFDKIKWTSEPDIRELRQLNASYSSRPSKAAVRPKNSDGTTGQRFELLLYPKPSAVYTLSFKMILKPDGLTSSAPYPLGGPEHAETIKVFCLREAEIVLDQKDGIYQKQVDERLIASINIDKSQNVPETLGYNSDPSNYEMDEVTPNQVARNAVLYINDNAV